MASSRPKQVGTLRSARTFDKASHKSRSVTEDVRVYPKSITAKDVTASNIDEVLESPTYKPGDSVMQRQGQQKADPYSLSDLDDDHGADMRGPVQVRKRKRSHAPTEQPSAKSRPSVPKVRLPTLLKAPEIVARKADKTPTTTRKRAATSGITAPAQASPNRLPAVAAQVTTPQRSKPRLIDALAAQRDADQESDSDIETKTVRRSSQERSRDIDDEIRSLLLPTTHTFQEGRSPAKAYTPRTTDIKTRSTRIKYTYSQTSRNKVQTPHQPARVATILEDPESDSILSSPLGPATDPFDVSDTSDAEEGKRLEIKSVHELRRAGANNRFSDELEDLLSRIGKPTSKPSTLRRNALLELSQKLQRDDFARQFRDHADRDTIAMSVGNDDDVVCGFALSAVLVQFLSDQPAPHLLHKLAVEGIGLLLGRLLLIIDDVEDIASWKHTNLSRHSRHAVAEMKSCLLRMDIWPEQADPFLAPRTIALKLLDMLYQSSTVEESSMISAACLDDVSYAASALMEEIETSSHGKLEFSLIVSIMEAQSNVAREMDQEVLWLRRQSSNARQSLQWTLQTWHQLEPRTRLATLKMAINATNTNDGASAFDSNSLLSGILVCINSEIVAACNAVEQHRLDNVTYESLLLVLGVMINIMEHCPRARSSVESRPINVLATLYAENRLSMSEADSEEKSKLSVAFGYLAVLLGYLSLSEPGLTIVRSIANGQGMRKLLGSIREFIDVYKNVESKIHGLEGLVSELQTRLI